MIILDTNALLWHQFGSDRLSSKVRDLIDRSRRREESYLSSISFWEVALLQSKQRIRFDIEIADWRRKVLLEGMQEIPVDGKIALRSVQLDGLPADPADRIIVSTALDGYQLVTTDISILNWNGDLDCIDARS